MLGAFGDPGHAFPLIALGCALRARGHEVTVQTWERWQPDIERVGLQFAPMSEYAVFPTRAQPRGLYAAAVAAARETAVLIEQRQPDAVVADILTIAPALAAERAGVPWATLIPHLHPVVAPGFPPFSLGARLPRGAAGRAMWRAVARFSGQGVELGRQELNAARRELGLAPLDHPHGGISRELCLVATFPQLEYPRSWAPSEHVVGPLAWEPPAGDLPPLALLDRFQVGGGVVAADHLDGLPAAQELEVEHRDAGVRTPGRPGVAEAVRIAAHPGGLADPLHQLLDAPRGEGMVGVREEHIAEMARRPLLDGPFEEVSGKVPVGVPESDDLHLLAHFADPLLHAPGHHGHR